MNMFYPLIDEETGATITGYVGCPITVTVPWRHPHMFDVLPLINFLRDSPQMRLRIWAYNDRRHFVNALSHTTHISNGIFRTVTSLRTYLDRPNANSFDRIMFRSHNGLPTHNHARLEIWFRQPPEEEVANGVDNLDWVDGKDWVWPKDPPPPPAPQPRTSGRATADRAKRRRIENSLRATGLYVDEIRVTWNIFLGIAGKHQRGGKGIKR
jgi:hypothetical protein